MNNKRIFRFLIVAVPLVLIAALIYAETSQLQKNSNKAKHLLINEVVADNLSTLKDENGKYSDWIELYNPTDDAVNLRGYYLSDSKNNLSKWAFPDVCIERDGYLVVFCDKAEGDTFLHTNFSINSDKETIYLSDENENVIDSIRLENQQCDISYGRIFGNANEAGFLPYSTPQEANPSRFIRDNSPEADWGEVVFSLEGGRYDEPIVVELSCGIEGAAILYTLDGSEPDKNAFVYKEPIVVANESRPNQYTTKKCILTPSANADNAETLYGVNEVYKATVIRARIVKDAMLSSSIQTNTYFIHSDYSLPVVSLTTEPEALFAERDGEYVLGYTHYTTRKYNVNIRLINASRKTDLTGHLEIYNTDGSMFKDDMTFSIAGGSSVSRSLQKSFNVALENKKITGDLLGASDALQYECFTLRGPGSGVLNENLCAYPSAFVSDYIGNEGVGGQKSRPCILFIDGEYWGIYSLMEPKGKEYISVYTGTPKKDITLVMPWNDVSDKEFDRLCEEIRSRSFGQKDDYEWLKTKVDIKNYMAAVLAEGFFGNTDGISNGDHNLYIYKVKDGLWKWQIYDFDCTMVDNENYFKEMLQIDLNIADREDQKNFSSWLFQKLWNCAEFREEFSSYVRQQCTGIYAKEHLTTAFDAYTSSIEPEMQENLRRCEKGYTRLKRFSFWIRGIDAEYLNYTMDDYEGIVNNIRGFLANRTERVLEFLDELEAEENVNAN